MVIYTTAYNKKLYFCKEIIATFRIKEYLNNNGNYTNILLVITFAIIVTVITIVVIVIVITIVIRVIVITIVMIVIITITKNH